MFIEMMVEATPVDSSFLHHLLLFTEAVVGIAGQLYDEPLEYAGIGRIVCDQATKTVEEIDQMKVLSVDSTTTGDDVLIPPKRFRRPIISQIGAVIEREFISRDTGG